MNSGSSAFIVLDRAFRRHHLRRRRGTRNRATDPCRRRAGALDHDDPVDAAGLGDRGIDIGLQRHLLAAAQAFIGGDDDLGLAVGDALGEAVGREAGEHHRMDRADPRAGQHRVGGFRNHRQIDRDAVALLDVAGAQDVGHLADFVVQLAIGDVLRLGRIVALPDDGGLVAALVEMAVDAVPGDVEHAVLEPFDRDIAGREGGVLDLGEGLDPVDALGLLGPEAVGVLDRARIHVAVLVLVDKGALGPFRGYVVNLVGHRFPSSLAASERGDHQPSSSLQRLCVAAAGRRQGGNLSDLGLPSRSRAPQYRPRIGLPKRITFAFCRRPKSTLSREWVP